MDNANRRLGSDELLEILSLSENAMAVYTTSNLIIQTATNAMIKFWGKDRSIIGMPLAKAVPELAGQPFIDLLKNVWNTGITYKAVDTPAELRIDGVLKVSYFDFEYRAIKNEEGNVYCILHTALDTTERHLVFQALKEGEFRELELNEELRTSNNDLVTVNKELSDLNKELTESYEKLSHLNKHLSESEARFRNLVKLAPVPITVYTGPDMVISLANDKILELWGRDESVIGKPLLEARPEMKGHSYLQVLNMVYRSGNTYSGTEVQGPFLRNGKLEEGFFDAIYQPLKDEEGRMTGIMAVVSDITDRVKSRLELERLYEQTRLAREAARLGVFDNDLKKGVLHWDERCRELFGIMTDKPVSFINDFLPNIHEEDRERAAFAVHNALNKNTSNGEYDVDYRTIGVDDGKVRWVKAKGKVFFDEYDQPARFIGILQDVTDLLLAGKKLERAEEMLRLSVEAARLGTWHVDFKSFSFAFSDYGRELFGFTPAQELSYKDVLMKVPEEYQNKIVETIRKSDNHTIEFPLTARQGGKGRWLRSMGKLYRDEYGNASHFAGIIMDVTEQKLDEQRKNDFIGMVSHELKTPLTSLKAYIQMLQARARKHEDVFAADALVKADNQIIKMTTMINSFLNISRLESGKLSLNKRQFDLNDLLREIILDTSLLIASHHINLFCGESLIVYADYDKIGQVVTNLLSNAIKYSPKNELIEVRCELDGNMARVSVCDHGMGIPAEHMDKLFERFYRIENQNTQNISGFGIGLYLCAEIIRRHDGQIWAESELGKGSVFFFNLPLVDFQE